MLRKLILRESTLHRNVLFLLVDGLEFSAFDNPDVARELAPTIASLIGNGFLQRIVTNGMITQVVAPPLFTQTYPLDYGGYNLGIKDRPRSFIEVIKEHGYFTGLVVSHDGCGPRTYCHRGCDEAREFYDHRFIVQSFVRRTFHHQIDLYENGEIGERELLSELQRDYGARLDYVSASKHRTRRHLLPRCLQSIGRRGLSRYHAERELLKHSPQAVLFKLRRLPAAMLYHYLGRDARRLNKRILSYKIGLWLGMDWLRSRINSSFRLLTRLGFSLVPTYTAPIAREIIDTAQELLADAERPWFLLLHLMDVHDGPKSSRYLNFLNKLRHVPRLRGIRRRYPTHRDFWRDLSLIYLDGQVARLLKTLENNGARDDTLVLVTGDHGMGWDYGRGTADMANLGFRTHYEHTEVPLILSPVSRAVCNEGVHDSMSISATLLDELGIDPDPSFQGRSVYERGKDASIVESVGRGNCDVVRRDIYFTIRSETHKLMVLLRGSELRPERLFDLTTDPKEYRNVVTEPDNRTIVDTLIDHLVAERGEILKARGVDLPGKPQILTQSGVRLGP